MNLAWLQVIEYCNWLSEMEGLPAAYHVDGNLLDENGRKTNDLLRVRGYRLLTEAEWEYAAYGGKKSRGYRYSGSDDVDEVIADERLSAGEADEDGAKSG
ncbi:MAG: Formylglycine-generating sulfatase enzyme [Synergistetes bacterium ADurb.BinA166]|nr:MAG: Formylglycine-generating sulfatase enzyme [Synergistetes bacterium ADurb.BinA166]